MRTEDGILVINAGSSSIKYAAYLNAGGGEPQLLGRGKIDGIGSRPRFVGKDQKGAVLGEHAWPDGDTLTHAAGTWFLMDWLAEHETDIRIVAAGHRVAHGGTKYLKPTRVDAGVIADLAQLSPLAPLHQPHNLAAIKAMAERFPHLPQVACFDTSFHRTHSRITQLLAIPRQFSREGVLRYGFHGISYEFIARRLPTYAPAVHRAVVAHLGSGASMCAIRDGRSIDSTMGFTAVDGLPMGTRTGAVDPGFLLYLVQQRGYDGARLESLLYKESGLLGVSGISNDMRDLLASDAPEAKEAVELFCAAIAKWLGALAMTMEGVDALVFTAGIGENAAPVRAEVCRRAAWLGLKFDAEANERGGPRISTDDSPISAWVIPTNEELMIALHTRDLLAADAAVAAVTS
ncbi:MAG: acetate/propionate family kinase [Rhodospirillales bacterium]